MIKYFTRRICIMDSINRKIAGALLFVGASQFTVGMIVAEAVYPNYSVSGNYISDLGVWGKPSAAIFNPSIILLGLMILISAYFIQREFRMGAITSFYVLAGLGPLLVGIFPENTFLVHGVPVIHSIAAIISFVFSGIAAIASYKITKGPFRYFSVILGVATLFALLLFATTRPDYLGIGGWWNGKNDSLSNPCLDNWHGCKPSEPSCECTKREFVS
jgi:hypothetical membrane protein